MPSVLSRLVRIIIATCVVAAFGSHAFGSKKQHRTNKPATSKTLVATEGVEHLGRVASEPMVVELSDGTLFVSGYDNNAEVSPGLWRSRDHGATWESVDVGKKTDGAIGDSDVDLAVGLDDTVYFVAMSYDGKRHEGTRIAVGASKDAGATWTWKVLSEDRFDDRPWIGVAPNGTAHVIWNDGNGVRYEVSQDRGTTWKERPRINDQGGSSHLAIGPHGEIAVRITPLSASGNKFTPGVDLIAVSRDGGKSWRKHPAPGERDWSSDPNKGTPRWVEPVAWDADGALYYLWGSQKGLLLARSRNQGKTWTNWHIVESDEVSYYPYLIARGHGELAATWSSGKDDTLRAHVAAIHVGHGKALPQVIESQPFQTDIWNRDPVVHRATAGEYIPIIFLRAGGLGVVTTIASVTGIEEIVARQRAGITAIQGKHEKRTGFKWWKFVER
ncbi:MAG: sialidase family protein [Candidatus Acidiferrales bacterium]